MLPLAPVWMKTISNELWVSPYWPRMHRLSGLLQPWLSNSALKGTSTHTPSPSSHYSRRYPITEALTIDGWTQGGPAYVGPPRIWVHNGGSVFVG